MIVTTDMFATYSGNYEDSPEAILLKETFLSSAEEIVTGYLGYNPVLQTYPEVILSGLGTNKLYLPVRQVTGLHAIRIDDTDFDPSDFVVSDAILRRRDYRWIFPVGIENIILSYTAGWEVSQMPRVITLSILRVATLMLSEMGGNIGLTGKSFADNSRTFINYSNYRKYLQPLDSLRIIRW